MRAMLLGLMLISSAEAQTPVVGACEKAVSHFLITDDITVASVQDFSALSPPRVTMRLDDFISTVVSCTFTSADPPMQIVEFCYDHLCSKAGDERFDEIGELMRLDGY